MAAITITEILNINTKAGAATDKYLSAHPSIILNGKAYTPAELKAKLQSESAILEAAEDARLRYRRLVADSRSSRKATIALHHSLKAYLTLLFGPSAVDVLGEFGFAPKAVSARSPSTTVKAIAKARATRLARHTMGKKQRLAIKAPVQPSAPAVPSDGRLAMGFVQHPEEGRACARPGSTSSQPAARPSSVVAVPLRRTPAMDPLRDKLSQQDWRNIYLRLVAYAKHRTSSVDDARDLAQSAITRLFAFDSKWDPEKHPDVFVFLTSIVNTLAYNARKRAAATRNISIDDGATGQETAARLADPNLTPDDAQAIHDHYARRLERLRARLADDPDAACLLELTLDGHDKPADLRDLTGWSDDVLRAARTRMQRAALAVARTRPDDSPKEKK